MSIESGALYVVATPIGHLDDWPPRARKVLAGVDLVAAEDTRHSGALLAHFDIHAPLRSLHEHNETGRSAELVERLRAGASIALISDAGTPGVSDPGYRLVVAAHEAGIRVIPVAGPSAVTTALAVAGQPTDRFLFEGFLPARAGPRRARLRELAAFPSTLVLFESCHRIEAALADLVAELGDDRPATLARELTKRFETVRRDTLGGLARLVAADPDQRRGEIVLVVAGTGQTETAAPRLTLEAALDALLPELPPSRAATVVARLAGVPKKAAYRAAMQRKPDAGD